MGVRLGPCESATGVASPNNQLAFYARGVVQSSPYVSAAIDSGTAVVTGFANESEANQFVTDAAK